MQENGKRIRSALLYWHLWVCSRNEDRKFSDLELVVVSKNKSRFKAVFIDGLQVWLDVWTLSDLRKRLTNPDEEWPFIFGNLVGSRSLYDKIGMKDQCKRIVKEANQAKFIKAAEISWNLAYERFGKIRNLGKKDGGLDLTYQVGSLLRDLDVYVALLNRTPVINRKFNDAQLRVKGLSLPENYSDLYRSLNGASGNRKIISLCQRLLNVCMAFGVRHGIEFNRYQSVEDVSL